MKRHVFSAKGAAVTSKPGAAPQDHGNPKTPALKARFTSRGDQLNRAFSACLHDDLNSWGDAPGWFKTAPLALNRNVRRLKLAFDTNAAGRLPN